MPDTPSLDVEKARQFGGPAAKSQPRMRAAFWQSGKILSIALGAGFFALESLRYLYLFRRADDGSLTQWLPDDAFYYLILGRNFVLLHKWTFDGAAPATGFHLLWGYIIALIYRLDPGISLHLMFTLLYFLAALSMAMGLSLTCLTVRRRLGSFSVLGPVAIYCTSLGTQLPNLLLESGLVVFSTSLAVYCVFGRDKPVTNRTLAVAFAAGFVGMLSRSDFGLLPFMMLVACFAICRTVTPPRAKIAGTILAGSVLGLVIVLGHTFLASGHFAQSSAIVKHRWASIDNEYYSSRGDTGDMDAGRSATAAISPLLVGSDGGQTLGRHPNARRYAPYVFGAIFLLLSTSCASLTKRNRRPAIAIVGAMSGVVIGYIALYAYDGAVQAWYFANYLVPYSVLAASVFSVPARPWRILCTAALAVLVWRASPVQRSTTPIYPQQLGFYKAGLYLRNHPELKPVGAWNAGIDSYAAGGGVINLDGLVNDDVAQYVLSGSLKKYMAARHIDRVVDDSIMWDSDLTREHGGYAGDVLTRCIDSRTTLWELPNSHLVGNHLLLSTLNQQCLSEDEAH